MHLSILSVFFFISSLSLSGIASGVLAAAPSLPRLITQYGCQSCHAYSDKRAAPSFHSIALRYQTQSEARTFLIQKLRKGGNGAWGSTQMPPQIMVPDEEAGKVIDWILQQKHPARIDAPTSSVTKEQ